MSSVASARRFPPLEALVAMLFWGASFVAVAEALESFPPFRLVALRLALGSAFLSLLLGLRGGPFLPERPDRARCFWLGVLLGAHVAIQAHGLVYTSASHSGWIVAFTSVVIALGAQFFRGEKLSGPGWLGVALALGGVLLVAFERLAAFDRSRLGDWIQFSSCFTWASYTLLGAGVIARSGALRCTTFAMLVAAALVAPFALLNGASGERIPLEGIAAILFLGIGASGIATTLWNRSIERHGSQRSAAVLYLQPFVTLGFAASLRGESVGRDALLGGALVLLGVFLVARARTAR